MSKRLLAFLLVSWAAGAASTLPAQSNYEPYRFTSFAGKAGESGNVDGAGGAARFALPFGVTLDNSGNVYVADSGNDNVRKITPTGVVSTVVTLSSSLFGIAVDKAGNLYLTEQESNYVRKITPTGNSSIFAGDESARGSRDGPGSLARFWGPRGLAIDGADNLYVADFGNATIRKITPAGIVSTIAGSPGSYGSTDGTGPAALFSGPRGLAVDGDNVYVADSFNQTIRKVTVSGVVTTIAGLPGTVGSSDGTGSAARFSNPISVAADGAGNVYVADINNQTIRKITAAAVVTTLGGQPETVGSNDGSGAEAQFNYPVGIAADRSGNIYVADSGNSVVRFGTPGTASQPLNISTRLRVLTGERVLIGGFIITGSSPKKVIVRGIAPSLSGVGVTLPDPTLELHKPDGSIVTNDNWRVNAQTGQSQEEDVRATTIPPANDLESAIVATLNPGTYTAILSGKGQATGVGLVEVYDLAQGADSKLANLSTRGFVDTGNNVMIGGFILGGGAGGSKIMARALGPSLAQSGISNVLGNPMLEIHDGNGSLIGTNDNWKIDDQTGQSQEAQVRATTIPPGNDLESAIVTSLTPGAFTIIVAGKDGGTGVGVVEIYKLQ
jgi:hypothetical protein